MAGNTLRDSIERRIQYRKQLVNLVLRGQWRTRETMVTVSFQCPYPGIKSCEDGILLENRGILNLEVFERRQ